MKRLFVSIVISLMVSLCASVWAQKEPDFESFKKELEQYEKWINKLEPGTKVMVELVDGKRFRIAFARSRISKFKEEPSLTDSQLKWLVTIEDLLVETDNIYKRARLEFLLSDNNMNPNAEMRRFAVFESVKTFSAAVTKHDKATRDLETLETRIELQKKKGSINPVPTTTP